MRVSRFFYFSRTRGSFLYVSSRHCQNRTQPLRTVTAKTDPDDCFFLVLFLFCSTFFFSKKRDAANLYHIEIFFFWFYVHTFSHFFFFFLFWITFANCSQFRGVCGKKFQPCFEHSLLQSIWFLPIFVSFFHIFVLIGAQGWDTFSQSQFCIANCCAYVLKTNAQ